MTTNIAHSHYGRKAVSMLEALYSEQRNSAKKVKSTFYDNFLPVEKYSPGDAMFF